jgi:hypothetical protein
MSRRLWVAAAALIALAGLAAVATARGGGTPSAVAPAAALQNPAGITESNLPQGFVRSPSVVANGRQYRFDSIPGHYWKLLDRRGFAVGLHFQTTKPFPWARGVAKGQLLYMIYAIPGTCGNGNYAQAVRSPRATIYGPVPPGFDHWHAFKGGGSKVGTWYTHIAVRDFTLAGPPGNPAAGTKVKAGSPKFIPVCDVIK